MLGHTKKPHTEYPDHFFIRGYISANKKEEAMQVLSELGFIDAGDSLPWEFMSGEPVLSIGEKLKGARYRENLTQKELSTLTGIPQGHISKIENNKLSVGKDRAKRLAQVLHVDYQILL